MQRLTQALRSHGNKIKHAVLQQLGVKDFAIWSNTGRYRNRSAFVLRHEGLENTTVAELLKGKGEEEEALYCCNLDDSVYDAVKNMTERNVGALVVVKPEVERSIAGIVTERDYLKKVIVQGRSSKLTKVREVMTEQNKLITVSPGTNILKAMELMTERRIRHLPVIDVKVVGMISIVDVVQAVVGQQREELRRLRSFINGDYY